MTLYWEGIEIEPEPGIEVVRLDDRVIVRTPDGAFSAVAVRSGDEVLVSYKGGQYRLNTRRISPGAHGHHLSGELRAPMPGLIVDVMVAEGDRVAKGQKLLILEAMKTQQAFSSPFDGLVRKLGIAKGDQIEDGDLLVLIDENGQ